MYLFALYVLKQLIYLNIHSDEELSIKIQGKHNLFISMLKFSGSPVCVRGESTRISYRNII